MRLSALNLLLLLGLVSASIPMGYHSRREIPSPPQPALLRQEYTPLSAESFSPNPTTGSLPLKGEDCTPIPHPRILSFDNFTNYISRPNKNWNWRHENYGDTSEVGHVNLELSGDGYVWIEDPDSNAPFYTLFENSQKWKLVNCSAVFAEVDVEKGSCTSPDLAIYYNATDLDEGETIMDRGMIGTTRDTAAPKSRSAWATYRLKGFSITAIPDFETPTPDQKLLVEIRAWDETGTYRGMERHEMVGGEVGKRIETVSEIFRSVQKWQVHVRFDTEGTPAMTDYLGVIIDDVEIEENVYDSKKCPYVNPESKATLRTLDLTAQTMPDGYSFDPNTTYYSLYERAAARAAARHPHDKYKQASSPLGYYSYGQLDMISTNAIFDPVSIKIRIDTNSLPGNLTFSHLSLSTETHITSFDRSKGANFHTPLTGEENEIVFEGPKGLNKLLAMQLMPVPIVAYWVQEIVVREWNAFPGTYRCGQYHRFLCEWPRVDRT